MYLLLGKTILRVAIALISLCDTYIQKVEQLKPHSPYLHEMNIIISSDEVDCPNAFIKIRDNNGELLTHTTKKLNTFSDYVVRDIVNGHQPTKIYFAVQDWQCCTCYRTFVDPAYSGKYPKNTKATEDLGQYIVLLYLSNSKITDIRTLANDYDVSEQFLTRAMSRYRCDVSAVYRAKPPCSEVWLLSLEYHDQRYLVAFGRTRKSKEKEDLVLLGFCDNMLSFAIKELDLNNDPNIPDVIYLESDFFVEAARNLNLHSERYEEENCPPEILRCMEIIYRFESERVRSDSMIFRLEFQNRYRREEVRRQGYGDYMPEQYSFSTGASTRRRPRRRETLVASEVSYSAADLVALLASFDNNDTI